MEYLSEVISYTLPVIVKILITIIPLMLTVAYLTYSERRVIGLMQLRRGPNVVGLFGLLQPIADAVKLMFKETIIPEQSTSFVFFIAPIIVFILSLVGWSVIPFSQQFVIANIDVGIMFLMAISALQIYGIIMAGWSSKSKYAFLGALRSSAQMISYELAMGISIICVLLTTGSTNLIDIIEIQATRPLWLDIVLAPLAVIFFISVLAETNRHPFDLPEAESEIVAGYHVEYSSMSFALFFLGEYANMVLVSAMTVILFMGGYLPPFNLSFLNFIPAPIWMMLKISMLLFVFVWIRATTPRYRYDQLMRIGWKVFVPITLFWLILVAGLLIYTGELPNGDNRFL